eukprot:SM000097S24754  [mRNA]  locus=s97:72267:80307:+ [translate_table: standard]
MQKKETKYPVAPWVIGLFVFVVVGSDHPDGSNTCCGLACLITIRVHISGCFANVSRLQEKLLRGCSRAKFVRPSDKLRLRKSNMGTGLYSGVPAIVEIDVLTFQQYGGLSAMQLRATCIKEAASVSRKMATATKSSALLPAVGTKNETKKPKAFMAAVELHTHQ